MNVFPLRNDRPAVAVQLRLAAGHAVSRWLVVDTGAGTRRDTFELIIEEDDCLQCGGVYVHSVRLRGAYNGLFPVYVVDVRVPCLNFDEPVNVVGVSAVPHGFDGIACFRFLRRFSYGNFGDPDAFGLGTRSRGQAGEPRAVGAGLSLRHPRRTEFLRRLLSGGITIRCVRPWWRSPARSTARTEGFQITSPRPLASFCEATPSAITRLTEAKLARRLLSTSPYHATLIASTLPNPRTRKSHEGKQEP